MKGFGIFPLNCYRMPIKSKQVMLSYAYVVLEFVTVTLLVLSRVMR